MKKHIRLVGNAFHPEATDPSHRGDVFSIAEIAGESAFSGKERPVKRTVNSATIESEPSTRAVRHGRPSSVNWYFERRAKEHRLVSPVYRASPGTGSGRIMNLKVDPVTSPAYNQAYNCVLAARPAW